MMMSCDDASAIHGVEARIEVFTAKARRRVWSEEDKARIVAESYSDHAGTVCDVARRNGICPSQLFTWRRQLRTPVALVAPPLFVPAVVEEPAAVAVPSERGSHSHQPARRQRRSPRSHGAAPIEVSMDGISVRIGRGADAALITAVLDALKGNR
jgi:transposase